MSKQLIHKIREIEFNANLMCVAKTDSSRDSFAKSVVEAVNEVKSQSMLGGFIGSKEGIKTYIRYSMGSGLEPQWIECTVAGFTTRGNPIAEFYALNDTPIIEEVTDSRFIKSVSVMEDDE